MTSEGTRLRLVHYVTSRVTHCHTSRAPYGATTGGMVGAETQATTTVAPTAGGAGGGRRGTSGRQKVRDVVNVGSPRMASGCPSV